MKGGRTESIAFLCSSRKSKTISQTIHLGRRPGSFLVKKKNSTLLNDIHNRKICACVQVGYLEISIPPSQYCYKPKYALKLPLNLFKQ